MAARSRLRIRLSVVSAANWIIDQGHYAQFFHTVSLGGRAYGFAYDDINDQSSVRILPTPTRRPASPSASVGRY